MGMSMLSNLAVLSSQNQYIRTRSDQAQSIERVSSGFRINRAEDDPAGLGLATNLDTTQGSVRQAMRNANDALSLLDTAEGGLSEVLNILSRLRESSVAASSETLKDEERTYIQLEVDQLLEQIDRLGEQTSFNGFNMLENSSSIDALIGTDASGGNLLTINFDEVSTTALSLSGLSLTTAGSAQAAIDSIDSARDLINKSRVGYGSAQNRIHSALENMSLYYSPNLESAESTIRDADIAVESSLLAKFQTMAQAGLAGLVQARGLSSELVSMLA
jgi:flagellin